MSDKSVLHSTHMDMQTIKEVLSHYKRAKGEHEKWHTLWQQCYDYTCPIQGDTQERTQVYDATACDAVDELSAVLMGEMIPRNSRWLDVQPHKNAPVQSSDKSPEYITESILDILRDSNLHMELHQAITDTVITGMGILLVEQSPEHRIQYTALRPQDVVLASYRGDGVLDTFFRTQSYDLETFSIKYGTVAGVNDHARSPQTKRDVLEAIVPHKTQMGKWHYMVLSMDETPIMITSSVYDSCPFVAFRWQRTSGSVYGRSPVMKTLPDIKTANKVVELTLKNAAISVTGIWQADDDGVLNPYTVRLVPGAIIPKAVGSGGLQPLKSPGEFNVSNMVLESLQSRIRKGLLADVFTTTINRTATEVQEHSLRARQVLNAVFERLTQECLTPLLHRSVAILERSGHIPSLKNAGMQASIVSPMERLAHINTLQHVQMYLQHTQPYQDILHTVLDVPETMRWVAGKMTIPPHLLHPKIHSDTVPDDIMDMVQNRDGNMASTAPMEDTL